MNRDDIIRMAKEAGVPMEYSFVSDATVWHLHPSFERFANLIYERVFKDANYAATRTVTDAAIALEQEACAKVCELVAREIDDTNGTATYCANAIRARGNK